MRKIWPQFNDLGQAIGQSIGIEAGEIKPVASPPTEGAGGQIAASFPVYQVIGVARDCHHQPDLRDGRSSHLSAAQPRQSGGEYLLRAYTNGRESSDSDAVRAEIAALNPEAL